MWVLYDMFVVEGFCLFGWSWVELEGGLYFWFCVLVLLEMGLVLVFCWVCFDVGVFYVFGEFCFGDYLVWNFVWVSFGVLSEVDLVEVGCCFVSVVKCFSL